MSKQYNKDLYKNEPAQNAAATRFGTWSYANTYDALYDKYSQNKNFNINMWRDAIKLGEQDNYFALLEQNKDNTLSSQFYDDEYYDYEAMMTEMYLSLADNTKTEKYSREIFDNITGKWETQDLGEMTQRQYFEYLLTETRAAKANEIYQQMEQEHKESRNFMATLGSDTLATLGELGEGVLTALTGFIDVFGALGYASYKGIEAGDNWTDYFVEYFGEVGLTQYEKETVRAALDEYERTRTHFRDIDGNLTNVGKYFSGIANSIGMMIPSILLAIPTGGTALSFLPQATFYASMFGNSMYETATNTEISGPSWRKILTTTVKTGAEAIIEWGLAKVLGGTIQNRMLNIGGRNLKNIKFTKASGLKYLGKSAAQEGLEEFLQDFGTSLIDAFSGLYKEGYKIDFQTLIDSFCIGALSSIVMSGARVGAGAMVSRARNRKLAGSGDIVIDVDGETQKVTGFNRLYYGEILNDFQEAVKELKNGKFGTKKNIALAQEVYGAISSISQFYSSFDKTRLENCEQLLSRVTALEKTRVDAKQITLDYAKDVEKIFEDMVTTTRLRHAAMQKIQGVKKAAEKAAKKLKKGDVKTIKSASVRDELQEKLDKFFSADGKEPSQKAKTRLEELHKRYSTIFTTDGNIAIDEDGFLFVSEAWLENYTTSQIYQFLAESQLLELILSDDESRPLLDDIEKYYKEFAKDETADREQILMNFLFNGSFYQAFILSNGGENIHKHGKLIGFFYNFIAGEGETWAHSTKNIENAPGGVKKAVETRQGIYTSLINRIRKAWREPTLKAILNWGVEPQDIGMDAILNKEDKALIQQYKAHKRSLLDDGVSRSAFKHRVEDILRDNKNLFTDEELALIHRVVNEENGTIEEDLQVRIMLDLADLDTSDITYFDDYSPFRGEYEEITTRYSELYYSGETNIEVYKSLFSDIIQHLRTFTSKHLSFITIGHKEKTIEKIIALMNKDKVKDYRRAMLLYENMANEIMNDLSVVREGITDYALILPYQVASLLEEGDTAGAQRVADELKKFHEKYGVSAREMMSGSLVGMSVQQRNQLTRDMEAFGTDNFVRFVQRYLENILCDDYIITPTAKQRFTLNDKIVRFYNYIREDYNQNFEFYDEDYVDTYKTLIKELEGYIARIEAGEILDKRDVIDSKVLDWAGLSSLTPFEIHPYTGEILFEDDTDTGIYDFTIAKKISAKKLLPQEIFKMSSEERADLFYETVEKSIKHRSLNTSILSVTRLLHRELRQPDSMAKTMRLESYVDFFDHLSTLIIEGEELSLASLEGESYVDDSGRVVDIADELRNIMVDHLLSFTGEHYRWGLEEELPPRASVFKRIFGPLITFGARVEDIINISSFDDRTQEKIREMMVALELLPPGLNGYYSPSEARIAISNSLGDPFATFIHEFNHRLQDVYNMPGGFNDQTARKMPDFLAYICNNYRILVNCVLRSYGLDEISVEITNEEDVLSLSIKQLKLISHLAYLMVQGEVWSRTFNHNGKPIHGFLEIFGDDGAYILTPDNKAKFKIRPSEKNDSRTSYSAEMTPVLAQSMAEVSLLNILKNRDEIEMRDTVHTMYSGGSTRAITSQLAGPGVSLLEKYRLTLDDFIDNPSLLIPEIQEKLNGDTSRGNVFYRIKEWVEEHVEGTSIDRRFTDNATIFVDDRTFDTLLTSEMLDYADNDDLDTSALQLSFGDKGEIPLKTFYKKSELYKLGIDFDLPVIISSKEKSEYVRNATINGKKYSEAIVINATDRTTDARLIYALNHEFRHLMQYHTGLHTGFTPDFEVTQEMIDDVKKHLPGVYKDKDLRTRVQTAIAKAKTNETVDSWITRHAIYYSVLGEINAYGFSASELAMEPAYVITEAGTPTIIMPWHYDDLTTGRYKTKYLSSRADDSIDTPKKKDSGSTLPRVKKKRKYTNRTVITKEDGKTEKIIYKYDKKVRRFNKKKAEGTNLMYYWEKGESYRQMDPEMQEFIIATTDHLDELPAEIAKGIEDAILTKEVLFKWIRETDDMNQFTFDLIKEHFFPNTAFNSFEEFNSFFDVDLQIWWAAVNVLKSEVDYEYILRENSVTSLVDFIESIKDTELGEQIYRYSKYYYGEKIPSKKLMKYQRLFALQYFDGSLNGAFYVANSFLATIEEYEEELAKLIKSTDARVKPDDTKDNAATTRGDFIADESDSDDSDSNTSGRTKQSKVDASDARRVGNDIIAIYGLDVDFGKSLDEMRGELLTAYVIKKGAENGFELDDIPSAADVEENPALMPILQEAFVYSKELKELDGPDIEMLYAKLINASLVGQEVKDDALDPSVQKDNSKKLRRNTRVNIRDRIKRRAKRLLKYIADGKIMFSQLPEEVQAMFTYEEGKTKSGKIVKNYVLRSEVYSVGRGRAKASKSTVKQTGRFTYQPETNITDDHEIFRHDITRILKNERILTDAVEAVKKVLSVSKQEKIKTDEAIRQVNKSIKDAAKVLEKALTEKPKKTGTDKVKEFRPKKKYSQTDTPNVFNIASSVDMPDVLYKILDTSFDEFADTEVQWVSVNEEGELYNKERKGKFDSLTKHEQTNWDAFYEANRETLRTLTRNDVLEIITYFANAKVNNGPVGKFAAFEIFLLGFFVDGARHNYNNWNFSNTEIANIEKLYEMRASAAGSALNAVGQMIKVVNPMKAIKDRMLEDWDTINDDDKNDLIDLIDKMRTAKTAEESIKYGIAVDELLLQFAERQREADKLRAPRWSKEWWSKLWGKIKTWRYMAMLSGPATWVRNQLGNTVLLATNKMGDSIGNLVFSTVGKKAYRENQWDLKNTATSEEAKNFIDLYIAKNPVFDPMYNLSGKYDVRRKKEIDGERGLFISVITRAYEKAYGAKANNFLTKIIEKGISDGFFIKGATKRYFGKMLTLEVAKGNIDLSEGLSAKTLDLFAEAVIMANAEYMHKRSALSEMLDSIRGKYPVLYEAISFFEPFLNSGVNWYVEKMMKLTPLGLVSACIRMARFEKQVEKLEARRAAGETVIDSRAAEFLIRRDIGKGVVATLFSIVGAILVSIGRIRIDEEDDKFYLYAGDGSVKIDISDLFGSSSLFVGASIAQLWVEQKDGDVASVEDMLKLLTETLADGFIAADFLKRHQWDNGIYEALLTETNSILSSFIPQMWQTIIACTNSKKIRYSSGMKGVWERWLNTFIPTQPAGDYKINPYTGKTESNYALPILGGLLKKGILGPKIWWVDVSETERMCREYGINRNELTGEITVGKQKKKLDRLALNKKYGELNRESLAKIKSQKHKVEMPNGKYQTLSWDKMNNEQRANVINRTMNRNADIAKVYIWTQTMDKKYYASGSLWEELRKLDITKNVYKGDKGFVE